MEHILQIGISVDDDRIRKSIEENAERKVIEHITKEVNNVMFGGYYDRTEPLKNMIKECINRVIEENKEFILDKASKILADKLARSKAGKELLENLNN